MRVIIALLLLAQFSLADELRLDENEDQILVYDNESLVLAYQKSVMRHPRGGDPLYDKSAFIHPLRTPKGGVVTEIFPRDHNHHMGIWHAWVKAELDGRELDFWNIADGKGGVRYKETLNTRSSEDAVEFEVAQEQFSRDENGSDSTTVVLAEVFSVSVEKSEGCYVIGYEVEQTNRSANPLLLLPYRYGGGIGYRAPVEWDKENSAYLTSEGLGREDGHATRARWVAMHGPTDTGIGGIAVLNHPSNFDSPQRVRIWPDGKVFFNYVPIQERGMEIGPDESFTMRYQVVVFDGSPNVETIERLYDRFAR